MRGYEWLDGWYRVVMVETDVEKGWSWLCVDVLQELYGVWTLRGLGCFRVESVVAE